MSTAGRYLGGAHVFVDESKAGGYFLAASIIGASDVTGVRKAVAELCRAGQRRVHFKSESDQVRKAFIAAVMRMPVSAVVYVGHGADRVARPRCLEALVADASKGGARRLVVERDASVEASDRRLIARVLRETRGEIQYSHCGAYEEPLLWISDAIAWCFQKGGHWRPLVHPVVADVRRLD